MAKDAWTHEELFEGLDPAPGFVAELERLGLLVVVGRDGRGGALYTPGARDELEKVLDLVELGYQPEDIAAIARRVGLPEKQRRRFSKPPVHLRQAEVAERVGVPSDEIAAWEGAGLLEPSLRSDAGEPLYTLATVTRAERLRDLTVLGVCQDELLVWGDTLDWLDTRRASDKMPPDGVEQVDRALASLTERLVVLGDTGRRWRRLLATFKRRLARLRPSAKSSKRGRRRLKTRTR